MGMPSVPQLLIILVIVVLIFGAKRLKNLGGDLGSAVKGFKQAVKEEPSPAELENASKPTDDVVTNQANAAKSANETVMNKADDQKPLLLIGIVALIVIGPERLPAVARTVGQWVAKLQRFVRGVKTDLASELESGDLKKLIGDQREQINELKQMVNSAKREFESGTREVVQGAKKSLVDMETSVKALDEPESPAHTVKSNLVGGDGATSSHTVPTGNETEVSSPAKPVLDPGTAKPISND
ncbi:unnamed protein product, partial [Cyprideis torosa]